MEAIVAGPARREQLTAEIMERTGIDEAMIERLVRGFYARVRADAVLGPIFEARIKDWEPHLARMCAFWSSVALMTGRYHGTPMVKHLPLPVDGASPLSTPVVPIISESGRFQTPKPLVPASKGDPSPRNVR